MSVYTDPKLLDVRSAVEALPVLPLDGTGQPAVAQATGTDASSLAPIKCKRGRSGPNVGKAGQTEKEGEFALPLDVTSSPDKTKEPLTSVVSGCLGMGATGLEPVTPSVSSWCSSQLS